MMKINYRIIAIIIICLVFNFELSRAQTTNVGKTAAPFLSIGVGSRAIGMGGAFVATANDASAMYWNSAGIAFLDEIEAIFVHADWIADMNFDYAGIIFPMGNFGTIGANITMLNMGEMLVRTEDRPEGTGEYFSSGDFCMGLSYGLKFSDRFALGINMKYIDQRIWHESANGYAIDLGTLYHTPVKGLRIGASLSNFGSDMQMRGDDLLRFYDPDPNNSGNNDQIMAELKTDSWPLPLIFQFGLAMDFLNSENHLLTCEVDAIHPIDNNESINLGVEYGFRHQYFLRAGYRNLFLIDSEEGFTVGGGLNIELLENFAILIDYAYADFGRLQNAQRFSIALRF